MNMRSIPLGRSGQAGAPIRLLLAMLLLLSFTVAMIPYSVSAAQSVKPIQLRRMDGGSEWAAELKQPIRTAQGRLYIWIQDARSLFGEINWVQATNGSQVTAAYPGTFAVFKPGARSAVVNGKAVRMDHPALLLQNNRMYVSLRVVADLIRAEVRYDSAQRVITLTTYGIRYIVNADRDAEGLVWLEPRKQQLYIAKPGQAPVLAGTTHVKLDGYGYIESERLDAQNLLVTLKDIYGEPGLGTNVFKLLVHQGRLTLESKASYYGIRSTDSLSAYPGGLVFVDGSRVLLARPDGTVTQKADIGMMLTTDEAATVVYASDDALIVKLYNSQMLAAIDLRKQAGALLYKQLLPADEQEKIEASSRYSMDFDYVGDGLDFDRREGQTFYFTHIDAPETTYAWTLS